MFEGKIAASNMLKGLTTVADYTAVPTTVFTIPELNRVGILEQEARDRGIDIVVQHSDTSGWYSNYRVGETTASSKIIIDKSTGATSYRELKAQRIEHGFNRIKLKLWFSVFQGSDESFRNTGKVRKVRLRQALFEPTDTHLLGEGTHKATRHDTPQPGTIVPGLLRRTPPDAPASGARDAPALIVGIGPISRLVQQ